MLWQLNVSKIEGCGDSMVHTNGSPAIEPKLCFPKALFLLFVLKEMKIQFGFLLQILSWYFQREKYINMYERIYLLLLKSITGR